MPIGAVVVIAAVINLQQRPGDADDAAGVDSRAAGAGVFDADADDATEQERAGELRWGRKPGC